MKLSRRQFLLLGVAAAGAAGASYVRWLEPEWLEVRELDVLMPRSLPSPGLKVLHLGDFHRSSVVSLSFIEEAIEVGIERRPDLICITGDFVTTGDPQELVDYRQALEKLSGTAPTFAVLGNHDGGAWSRRYRGFETTEEVSGLLRDSGITLLHNTAEVVSLRGNRMRLVGTADLWSEEFDAEAAFLGQRTEESSATLLLAHNPDTKDKVEHHPWDLMLSGHTHGGQVVVPLLGAPWAPVRDRRFLAGLGRWKGRLLHITRGVGNLLGVRLNCRPQVTLLNLY